MPDVDGAEPIGSGTDPAGNRVVLWSDRWQHIQGSPGRSFAPTDVLDAISEPDHASDDPRPQTVRYWKRGLGPAAWMVVAVRYDAGEGWVVTAYPENRDPQ